MIIKKSELDTVCGITSHLPAHAEPEIAFAGRSNVGKSSLINSLLGRRNLARTSSKPGKTATINFYKVNDAFFFVDLPGYGYAARSAKEREGWARMINRYLTGRKNLSAIILIVDMRIGPTKDDLAMLEWIRKAEIRPVIACSKADKLKRSEMAKQIKKIRMDCGLSEDEKLFPFSAVTKAGREELLQEIAALTGADADA